MTVRSSAGPLPNRNIVPMMRAKDLCVLQQELLALLPQFTC